MSFFTRLQKEELSPYHIPGVEIEPFAKTSEREVDAFERNMGVTLPEDYRRFLLSINGGLCYPSDNSEIYVKEANEHLQLDCLYGMNTKDKSRDIATVTQKYRARLPQNAVLIGEIPMQGFYVLVCGGAKGGVYYWKIEEELDPGEVPGFYYIVPFFMDFWNAFAC